MSIIVIHKRAAFRRSCVQPNMIQQPLHAVIGHPAPSENPIQEWGYCKMSIKSRFELVQNFRPDPLVQNFRPVAGACSSNCRHAVRKFLLFILSILANWKLLNPCADLSIPDAECLFHSSFPINNFISSRNLRNLRVTRQE